MQIFIACRRRAAKLAHKMMSQAENERFTRVGPGTPMGDLMRRYWHPIAGVSELKRTPVKPVRLLGEDLVLYRDGQGNLGLIDRHRVGKAERVEKLPLILVEPTHHHAPPQKTFLETPNHRSTPTSTDFCNKIGQ
jgi:hypothetical protein